MRIDVLTLFPNIFKAPLEEGIMARAGQAGLVDVRVHDLRPFGLGRHREVDDAPYGGGAGMVMRPEPIEAALESIVGPHERRSPEARIVFMTPQGRPLSHERAVTLSGEPWLVLLCGRYEGVDERIRQRWVDEEISIGDYVLTGGELPALVLIDAVVRLLPGALGNAQSAPNDSFARDILDHPHYTRPERFKGLSVPPVLLSGHHAEIAAWRRRQALRQTLSARPDLLKKAPLSPSDIKAIKDLRAETSEENES
jgi:tRNA (guanine37-N1)-methyltransferase